MLQIAGWEKPLLLKKSYRACFKNGLKLSVVKHAHHNFDVDQPGKDSYRLRKAGAYQTLIMNQKRSALLTEFANDPDTFEKAIKKMDQNVDLIIIEGLKSLNFPKIEVYRSTTSLNKLVDDDPSIIAVVSDMMFPCKKPLFDINNTDAIEQFICNLIKR